MKDTHSNIPVPFERKRVLNDLIHDEKMYDNN